MWVTALVIGFAGSMHCLGMCSPLVLALTGARTTALFNRFVYNAGRITMYGVLGSLVAGAGMMLPLHQYQDAISIVLGIILVVIGLGGIRKVRVPAIGAAIQCLTLHVKKQFAQYLTQKSWHAMFIMGALNGMLPCGLTVVALTWCLTLKGPIDGFNFMLLFGIGTLPVMLGFTALLPVITGKLRWSLPKLTTSMLILSGCILIARVFIIHLPHTLKDKGQLIDIILCQ